MIPTFVEMEYLVETIIILIIEEMNN